MINFAGVSSDDVNVVVEAYPERPIPERRYTVTRALGRSGNIVEDETGEPTYNEVERRYQVYLSNRGGLTPYQESARLAAAWLTRPAGYQMLYDSYDADAFCYARFVGPVTITNAFNELGRAEIVFACDPWRYLISGTRAITINANKTLLNPSDFASLPLIVVHGRGSGRVDVGGYIVTISAIDDGMMIDSALQDCYKPGPVNRNGLITLTPQYEYPRLLPGENRVSIGGGVTSIEIIPRWRTL